MRKLQLNAGVQAMDMGLSSLMPEAHAQTSSQNTQASRYVQGSPLFGQRTAKRSHTRTKRLVNSKLHQSRSPSGSPLKPGESPYMAASKAIMSGDLDKLKPLSHYLSRAKG